MDTLDKIIDLLKQKGVSQKNLTDYLGLSKGIFSDWKNSKTNSYLRYISQIAEYFNVSTDYLLGKTENIANESTGKVSDNDIKFALFNGADNITDEMYEEVKRFARYIKNNKENEEKKV